MEENEEEYKDPNDEYCTDVFRLPSWIFTDCPKEQEVGQQNFYLMSSVDNGDCLFHSVHMVLMSILGSTAYTSYELRYAVAKTMLDEDNQEAIEVMTQWRSLLKSAHAENDKELWDEFKHAEPLLQDTPPFKSTTRHKVYTNMLNPQIYWGDQYAVKVLEHCLQIKLLILRETRQGKKVVARGQMGEKHNSSFHPTWYGILLLLRHLHYMPIGKQRIISEEGSKKEEFCTAFKEKDIPRFVYYAFKWVKH